MGLYMGSVFADEVPGRYSGACCPSTSKNGSSLHCSTPQTDGWKLSARCCCRWFSSFYMSYCSCSFMIQLFCKNFCSVCSPAAATRFSTSSQCLAILRLDVCILRKGPSNRKGPCVHFDFVFVL